MIPLLLLDCSVRKTKLIARLPFSLTIRLPESPGSPNGSVSFDRTVHVSVKMQKTVAVNFADRIWKYRKELGANASTSSKRQTGRPSKFLYLHFGFRGCSLILECRTHSPRPLATDQLRRGSLKAARAASRRIGATSTRIAATPLYHNLVETESGGGPTIRTSVALVLGARSAFPPACDCKRRRHDCSTEQGAARRPSKERPMFCEILPRLRCSGIASCNCVLLFEVNDRRFAKPLPVHRAPHPLLLR